MPDICMIHKLPHIKLINNRSDFILKYCRDKNILHLGCVESGTTEVSFNKGSLLHLEIIKIAKKTIGIDIDKNGIDFLANQGIPNLICLDVEKLYQLRVSIPIDVIVAGELLEHLPNPGLCIEGMSKLMNEKTILIVTVPNAFSLRHFLSVFVNRKELVFPDHNYYFSYITLNTMLSKYNLQITEFYAYSNLHRSMRPLKRLIKKVLNNTIFRLSPFSAEGVLAIANKNPIEQEHQFLKSDK